MSYTSYENSDFNFGLAPSSAFESAITFQGRNTLPTGYTLGLTITSDTLRDWGTSESSRYLWGDSQNGIEVVGTNSQFIRIVLHYDNRTLTKSGTTLTYFVQTSSGKYDILSLFFGLDEENQIGSFFCVENQDDGYYIRQNGNTENLINSSDVYNLVKLIPVPVQTYTSNGGGATHIAKVTGQLSSLSNNLSDILIVSGGGGGGMIVNDKVYEGADAGGIAGNSDNSADQTTGYAFGQGEDG